MITVKRSKIVIAIEEKNMSLVEGFGWISNDHLNIIEEDDEHGGEEE